MNEYCPVSSIPMVLGLSLAVTVVGSFESSAPLLLRSRKIVTPESPSLRHRIICRQINDLLNGEVEMFILPPPPFVDFTNEKLDLKRFSRYWRTVKNQALKPTNAIKDEVRNEYQDLLNPSLSPALTMAQCIGCQRLIKSVCGVSDRFTNQ